VNVVAKAVRERRRRGSLVTGRPTYASVMAFISFSTIALISGTE
jgi:hypothetical protein